MTRAVLIDCDPGIDDMVALLTACASPELDLRGVTTVGGNTGIGRTTRNARSILALAGRDDPATAPPTVDVVVDADSRAVVDALLDRATRLDRR